MNRTSCDPSWPGSLLLTAIILAAVNVGCSPAEPERASPAAAIPSTNTQQAILKGRGGDLVITLKDAQDIRAAVEQYLSTVRPTLHEGVPRPGDVFIDFAGDVRMGDWMREPSYSESADVVLTFLIEENQLVRLDQIIEIKRVGSQWKVVSIGVRTAHRSY